MKGRAIGLAILLSALTGSCSREHELVVAGYPLAPWAYGTPSPKAKPKSVSQPKSASSSKPRPASSNPTPRPSTAAIAKPTAEDLLNDLQRTMSALKTYALTAETQSVRVKDGTLNTTQTQIRFRGPNDFRIDVQNASNGLSKGAKIVFEYGQPAAKVKMGGILGMVTLDVPLTDYKLCTYEMWPYDQIVSRGMLDRVQKHPYKVELAGTAQIGGSAVTLLKLTIDRNPLDDRIAYELIGVDANKHMRLWAAYGKPELGLTHDLIFQVSVTQFQPNTALSDSLFKL